MKVGLVPRIEIGAPLPTAAVVGSHRYNGRAKAFIELDQRVAKTAVGQGEEPDAGQLRRNQPQRSTFRKVADLVHLQRSLEDAAGKLTVTAASIDFFVGLVCKTIGEIVALRIPKFLTKFGEAGFACYSDLPAPLVPIESSLRLSDQKR
jgi:hypothetical protein